MQRNYDKTALAIVLACNSQTDRGTSFSSLSFPSSKFPISSYISTSQLFASSALLARRVLSFSYKFTCPRGNVEGIRQDKTVHRWKWNCSKSRSRIKIIYTTFTAATLAACAYIDLLYTTQFSMQFLVNGQQLHT